ncbi:MULTISPECIES: entericidin A/B family lipoprotein [Snodgrassella]|uniref:Entericidin n=1 Tax=Snodgrassella alvi TaxID=1196083 RepID=A0A2N9WT30_9NEIS|nr:MULTISPECIES: entericidin A/B family lipoprotein [Snodgrassella]NUE67105.1 entericidin A/B family lipoprotein [Snodgrassella sp. ESL0253]PIT14414.1 entericidin [Snodgrassella alvi]PIT18231.1 entericidin [Snodgrassella alvi]PIT21354.1 entericidin [Snodgrassella alvi]
MKKLMLLSIAIVGFLAGCHTVSGVGRDISSGGQAVSNASDHVRSEM